MALKNHVDRHAIGNRKGRGKGKGKGKVVPSGGDDEDEEVPVADGEVGADGWRRTYRNHQPEKAPPFWKYMAQCYRNQKGEGVTLAGQHLPWVERVCSKQQCLATEKARRRHARRLAAEKKKALQEQTGVPPADSDSDSSSGSIVTAADSSSSSSSSGSSLQVS